MTQAQEALVEGGMGGTYRLGCPASFIKTAEGELNEPEVILGLCGTKIK